MSAGFRILALLLAASSLGCAGYRPLRWPNRDLWAPNPSVRAPIEIPSRALEDFSLHAERDGVTAALQLVDPAQAREIFHAGLVGNGAQPIYLLIRNGSPLTYLFSKGGVDPHYLPAAKVARIAYDDPVRTLARHVKWLAFLIPGVIFESVIEPATTLEFPGIEDAARRPPASDAPGIKAEFMRSEIADAAVPPDGTHAGVMFIRPPRLGGVIPMTLIEAETRRPLVITLPLPPPVYAETRKYRRPYGRVWSGAVKAAGLVKSWRAVSSDPKTGVITARKGFNLVVWRNAARITVTVTKINEGLTRVQVQRPLPRSSSAAYGERDPSVSRFFDTLDALLPTRPRRKRRSPPRSALRRPSPQPAPPPASSPY